MPGLVAFNRRWRIGADDLFCPAVSEALLRASWCVALIVFYAMTLYRPYCQQDFRVHVLFLGLMVVMATNLLLSVAIAVVSSRGGVMDTAARRRMPLLIYIRLVLAVPEVTWTIMGTIWAFNPEIDHLMLDHCGELRRYSHEDIMTVAKVAVIVEWVVLGLPMATGLVTFDPLGGKWRMERQEAGSMRKQQGKWKRRCQALCCCIRKDENSKAAFDEVATILSDFFKDVDVVVTDIAAGLILLRVEQELFSVAPSLHSSAGEPPGGTGNPLWNRSTGETTSAYTLQLDLDAEGHGDKAPSGGSESSPPGGGTGVDGGVAGGGRPEGPGVAGGLGYLPKHATAARRSPAEWMTLAEAALYMRFAAASYGWSLFVLTKPVTGLCRICSRAQCCCPCMRHSHEHEPIKDPADCAESLISVICNVTGVSRNDVIYVNRHNKIYEPPFYLAVVEERHSIVISIRGTLSLQDALTDMTAQGEDVDPEGPTQPAGQAHKGMLLAARAIQNKIYDSNVLQLARDRCPGYKLVVTGHSLGAGVAAILAILLRPKNPDVICFAFSPPGWLLSRSLSDYTSEFICSVLLGNDIVPRLGLVTMETFKRDLMSVLYRVSLPKYRILAGGLFNCLCALCRLQDDHILQEVGKATVSTIDRSLREAGISVSSGQQALPGEHLYLPGHIIFMEFDEDENDRSGDCSHRAPRYRATWRQPAQFDRIRTASSMLTDHMPDSVLEALEILSGDQSGFIQSPEHTG